MLRPSPVGGERTNAPARWHPLMLIPLALSAWVYYPILRINLFADEFVHFAAIESDGILDFLLAPFGGHNYLVRNLFLIGAWELFGLRAPLYYALSLLTHLLNVALLFGVIRSLTASAALACFGAALWGTSPLCLGTIGWFSVYGQMLVATILLVTLGGVARAAATTGDAPPAMHATWWLLLVAGTTCFGVGIGVALAFPLVVLFLLPATWRHARLRAAWLLLPLVSLGLYFAFRRLYAMIGTLSFQETMQNYVAYTGLAAVPAMFAYLLAFSVAGAVLGFLLPATFPSPAAWIAVAGVLAGVALILLRGDAASRRATVALLALGTCTYLLIAVGRGGAYAMFDVSAAQAARVQRYHYVGGLATVMVVCLILRELGRFPGAAKVPAPVALVAGLGLIVYGIARVGITVQQYRYIPDYLRSTDAAVLAAVRAQPPGTTVYVDNDKTPRSVLGGALPNCLFPGRAGVFVLVHPRDEIEGRTVRFVDSDTEVLEYYAARPHARLSRLIVRAEQVPATP